MSHKCVPWDEKEWYREKFWLSVSLPLCKDAGAFFVKMNF